MRKTTEKRSSGEVVGVIGDTHLPYEHPGYLNFCRRTFEEQGVTRVVQIGDLIDHHALSFHDSEPCLRGAYGERIAVQRKLQPWFDAFPELTITEGNHCKIPARHLAKLGIDPAIYLRSAAAVYGFPPGWEVVDEIVIDGVLYDHGDAALGVNGFRNYAKDSMCNTVTGHAHSNFGVSYTRTAGGQVWGCAVGCGIDPQSPAYRYGKKFKLKPVLGCAVILEGGRLPVCFPMLED